MGLSLESKAGLCYDSALRKKALDVVALDLRGLSDVTDVFLIASATSTTQAKAIVDEIVRALRQAGEKRYHIEGYNACRWILIDVGDVVVHVFLTDTRRFYDLERLWVDAVTFEMSHSPEPEESYL